VSRLSCYRRRIQAIIDLLSCLIHYFDRSLYQASLLFLLRPHLQISLSTSQHSPTATSSTSPRRHEILFSPDDSPPFCSPTPPTSNFSYREEKHSIFPFNLRSVCQSPKETIINPMVRSIPFSSYFTRSFCLEFLAAFSFFTFFSRAYEAGFPPIVFFSFSWFVCFPPQP